METIIIEPKMINSKKPRNITLPENNFQINNALLSPHYNLNRSLDSRRPMLRSHHSFDASSRIAADQPFLNKNSSITVEPVTFASDYTKSDTKSIRSFSGSKKKKKNAKKKNLHVSLTDIFANNLNEAVLDVNDSNEDGYVYNNTTVLTPPILNETQFDNNDYFSHKKRPRLRSAVSELPMNRGNHFDPLYKYYNLTSSDEDEENSPLLYKRKRDSTFMLLIKNPTVISWVSIISSFSAIICLCMMLF